MHSRLTRRSVLGGAIAAPLIARARPTTGAVPTATFALPIGLPDHIPGDGFVVRHGYASENTLYNPGWLHTGEDWYLTDGDTAGASIYAVGDGEVVFAGSEYPGLVVIVRHATDLYSMYGHLAYDLAVEVGEPVERGQPLGTVLARSDGRAPSHLHFEVRTFLTTPEVNGNAPRYAYGCGYECPPGPGYWPLDAPEHPSAMGWRNPTHVIAHHSLPVTSGNGSAEVIVAAAPSAAAAPLWSAPLGGEEARSISEVTLPPGDRFPLLEVRAGAEDARSTSAEGYAVWYRLGLPDGRRGWVQAAVPSTAETGSDGRPSSVVFNFYPAVAVEP